MVAAQLMEAEISAEIGTGKEEVAEAGSTHRSGYGPRSWVAGVDEEKANGLDGELQAFPRHQQATSLTSVRGNPAHRNVDPVNLRREGGRRLTSFVAKRPRTDRTLFEKYPNAALVKASRRMRQRRF